MKHSIPYTYQQNGVVKRKNGVLDKMITCMMEFKTLPPNFWDEAINCESYIQNKVPHKHLDGFTPFESWRGHKPYVSNFMNFGSRSCVSIPLDKGRDLETQSQE